MTPYDLDTALAEGVTVVTPNKRLARMLAARHDAAMARAGRRTWEAARVLPWQSWLDTLWLDAVAAHAVGEPPIAPQAAALLWDRIVAQDSELLDPRGAAERAADAWATFHAWRRPGESMEPWARAGIGDDASTFARWGREYARLLADRGLADADTAADRLAAAATQVAAWRDRRVVLAGFLETTPQQARLLEALRDAGLRYDEVGLPLPRAGRCVRTHAATPEVELATALTAARARVERDSAARVGIVIADLDERRADVLAMAEDLLCPALAQRCAADAPRPYSVSFGTPLADVALVACALTLVEWARAPMPLADAAAALRCAYLPGSETRWMLRAGIETAWRKAGTRDVDFAAAVAALARRPDEPLAARWQSAAPPPATRQSPAAWANAWRLWLAALGWPGDRPLGSGAWQARDAFLHVLGDFAALSPVAPQLRADEAVAALRAAARRTLFQPEGPPARIQVLGLLEAAGLDFDALWIAGLGAAQWPPPASPKALLPLGWQRDRGVPRSDGMRSLAYARSLTAAFAQAADDVVASHALRVDGQDRVVSALVAAWPEVPAPEALRSRAAQMELVRPPLAWLPDAIAPALPVGAAVRGGVDVVESQSTCPFQAFARHRLAARGGEEATPGLSPQERGVLLHRTLAEFWRDVRDHATLVTLDDTALRARIDRAVAKALARHAPRLAALPPPVARAESGRLASTLRAWLVSVERERAPFTVLLTEAPAQLALGGLVLGFQVDRVDALADGGVAIIDYKSGRAPAPGKWFAERPSGTQVGLYALAQQAAAPERPVVAAAYATLKAGSVQATGLAAAADLIPGVRTLPAKNIPLASWDEVAPAWSLRYGALAGDFANGHAEVAPRDNAACRWCELSPLCRIQRVDDAAADGEGGDDE